MRVLAVLLAACLFLGCTSKPVPERLLHKRDDDSSDGNRSKPSRDFKVVDDMLSTLDQCFHVLQKAVDDCSAGADNQTSKSQELSDEREESDDRRTGIRKTEPQTEPPTTPPTVPPRPNSGTTVIVVHGQEEEQEKTADQQGIGNRDKERGRTEAPPTKTVIVHVDRDGKQKSDGNQESSDESAESQTLRKGDSSLFDRDDRKEEEEEEENTVPPPSNVIIIHVDRKDDDSEAAGASSQAVGKDRDKGRDDGDYEKPTPDVIVVHINRKDGGTSQEEEAASPLPAVDQSRRKPTEAPTELPTAGNPPHSVIVIHTYGKGQDADEEAEAEGLRRTEATEPPTEPPTRHSANFSRPSTDVIVIHRDWPSDAEIKSDIEYALHYWSKQEPTNPPTESTQAPPTAPPRGPVRIIIIPDARDESIDEIVSQVSTYSLGGRFRFRNKNEKEEEEENLTEPPTTIPSVGLDSPLIIVIDHRPYLTTTTTTEAQTDPPTDDSSAINFIQLAAKKLKTNTPLEPVNSQAKGNVNKGGPREGIDLYDLRELKERIKTELGREGMFMYPVAEESSRERDDKRRNNSADSRDDNSDRRNKTTDVTKHPTEEPSATIETDASNSPTNDDTPTSTTEEPTTGRHDASNSPSSDDSPTSSREGPTTDRHDASDSPTNDGSPTSSTEEPTTGGHHASDSTTDTEVPSDSTATTTDHPTDSGTTDVSTDDTDSQSDTHSPDATTDIPTHSTEPAAEAGEWPMESVFYEHSVKSSSGKSKKADVMDKALEDYLHFRRRRQDDSSELTPQECLQLFSTIIETHYADRLTFLDK